MSQLAFLGGEKSINPEKLSANLKWPIVTREDEQAILDVLHTNAMSGTGITEKLEEDFCRWLGVKYALGHNNGTNALLAAMWAAGLGRGDEMICPSFTYWASVIQVMNLGATPVFADIDAETLCISPADIERRITPRTKAVMVVHYLAHPADMDAIMAVAKKHNLKVIEDVSHAQGGIYKGKRLGTIGDVAAMSLMSGKSLACGEAGMLVTNDKGIYDRAIAWGHYERFDDRVTTEYLLDYKGLPLGGFKNRMHQMSAAMCRVQLKYYDERCAVIRKSVDTFWDCLRDYRHILRPVRVDDSIGNMAGWYIPCAHYNPEAVEGLSVGTFLKAIRAEGDNASFPGGNAPLHTQNLLRTCDIYGDGKPRRIAFSDWDVRQGDASLPVTGTIQGRIMCVPWFKRFDKALIEETAAGFIKVMDNYKDLLEMDKGAEVTKGSLHFFAHSKEKDKTG